MCNLINTHTHTHTHTQDDRAGLRGCVQFNKYTHTHTRRAGNGGDMGGKRKNVVKKGLVQ